MYTLVVVDMQPDFDAANGKRVNKNCLREINEAVQTGSHIIFLEFVGYGATHLELMKPVENYPYHCVKSKRRDDGSREVQDAVLNHSFMIGRFRVVGINTDYCVFATVDGLRRRFPNSFIEVVRSACDSNDDHQGGVSMIRALENVDVI